MTASESGDLGRPGEPSETVRDVAGRAFEQVCDALADHLSAEHVIVAETGHGVQFCGRRFNDRLAALLMKAHT